MKDFNSIIGLWVGSMLIMLLLVACAEDGSTDQPQGDALRLMSVTRTGSAFNPDADSHIKMLITTKDVAWTVGQFDYDNAGQKWLNDNLSVKEHTQYYIYGYMPNDNTLISESSFAKPTGKDFASGVDLTLKGMPMFTTEDICVIVGVQRVTNTTADTELVEGNYSYLSGLASENYVNLLMGHLYCKLILKFNVDKDYYALRRIHLTSVTLKSTYGDKVDARIPLKAGSGIAANTVIYSKHDGAADVKELSMFEATTENPEKDLPSSADTDEGHAVQFAPINCAPCTFVSDGSKLDITCTYDVYDIKGNKVREGCTATNKVKLSGMNSGVQRTLTLTVAPTYLFVLSDDDLNNPTIKIN